MSYGRLYIEVGCENSMKNLKALKTTIQNRDKKRTVKLE